MNPSPAWLLLSARSAQLQKTQGGHERLTKDDVCSMLSGLDIDCMKMGMASECGDAKALRDLELKLWQITYHMAIREKWKLPKGEFVTRRMAGLALYEVIGPLLCLECNGMGVMVFSMAERGGLLMNPSFEQINPYEGRIRCPACQGSGKVRLSNRKRADLAGINKDTWPKYWSSRYEGVYSIPLGWLSTARSHLARELEKNAAEIAA